MTRILTFLLLLGFVLPASAQRKYNRTSTDSLPIYMVMVKGGSFDLGTDYDLAEDDKKPAHTVVLKDFYMGAYEVTKYQWGAVMGDPGANRCSQCPVTNVSWNEVQEFIEKLNARTGRHFRLPTEAEWEYAARGGQCERLIRPHGIARGGVNEFLVAESRRGMIVREKLRQGKRYAGQQQPGEVAWFLRNSKDHVHPIGRKKPNELEIYDMSGNVEEWCADWYAPNYGSSRTVENPKGPSSGKSKVVRGGSIASGPDELVVTRRAAYLPNTKSATLGFRLVEDK